MRHGIFVVVIGLVASPVAQAETPTPPSCALHQPQAPRPHGLGTIIALQDPAASQAGIAAREAQQGGAIDSRYRGDLRVTVRQDNGTTDRFDIPQGMTAHIGDRVKLLGSYRSTGSACSYIPHMAIPDDAPVA